MNTPKITEAHRQLAANMIGSWKPKEPFMANLDAYAAVLAEHDAALLARVDALRARVTELETRLLDSAEDWAFCGLDPSKAVEPLAKLAEYRTAARFAEAQRDALIASGGAMRARLESDPLARSKNLIAAWDSSVKGAPANSEEATQ